MISSPPLSLCVRVCAYLPACLFLSPCVSLSNHSLLPLLSWIVPFVVQELGLRKGDIVIVNDLRNNNGNFHRLLCALLIPCAALCRVVVGVLPRQRRILSNQLCRAIGGCSRGI